MDNNEIRELALAMIAGASMIERNKLGSEIFSFGGVSIAYGEAAELLRQKAVELIYSDEIEDKVMEVISYE